jgi:membrane protein DedA with SNARE-associated domain
LIHSVYGDLWVWVQAHGMAGVWVFMFVENMGVPFPTELGYIAAQSLVAAGIVPLWWAYVVVVLGHLSGAAVTYHAGRASHSALGRWFTHRKRLMQARDQLQKWYARFGPLTLLFGRLVGQVRPWSSLVAGMASVPPGVFWLWTVIGTLIYTALAMWVTVWGFNIWARFPTLRVPLIIATLAVFYGSMMYALIYRWVARHYRRRKAEREAAEQTDQSNT